MLPRSEVGVGLVHLDDVILRLLAAIADGLCKISRQFQELVEISVGNPMRHVGAPDLVDFVPETAKRLDRGQITTCRA
jgi:hypothetical protein